MIFNSANYHDIIKYYSGTIIKTKETGDRLWRIGHITPKEVELTDCDNFTIYLDLTEDYEVDYPMPGRVVYQNGDSAWMLYRKPAKQYYRGLHTHNTGLLALINNKWLSCDINIDTLQQFVDKPCYQNLQSLSEQYESWALNPYFSVSRQGGLFCLNKQIGTVNFQTKTIKLVSFLFKDEVTALMSPDWKFV